MTIAALQKRVKDNISFLKDKSVLEKINQLIEENSQVYILSENQINLVNEAQQQFVNGEYVTQDEMDKNVQAWKERK